MLIAGMSQNRERNLVGYFDHRANVEDYVRLAKGSDGELLIEALRGHLPQGSKLLELGMGPGKDLLMLNKHFRVTGSDVSAVFLERFRKLHPGLEVKLLDARSIGHKRAL